MGGRGACMAGGVHGIGGMCGRGDVCQGACMADATRYGQ